MSFFVFIFSIVSLFCTTFVHGEQVVPLELKNLQKKEDFPTQLSDTDFITEKNKNIFDFFQHDKSKKQWLFFNKKKDLDPLKSREEKSKVFAQSLYSMSRLFYGDGDEHEKGAMLGFAFADRYEKMNDIYALLPMYEGATATAGTLKENFKFIKDIIGHKVDDKKISNLTEAMLFRANGSSFKDHTFTAKGKFLPSSNFDTFRKEAIAVLAHQYKIHLQVRQEYIVALVQDLLELIAGTKELNSYVVTFKIARYYQKGIHLPLDDQDTEFEQIPVIVLYIALIPGDKNKKQAILDSIVAPLVKRYGKIAGDIALKDNKGEAIQPRFNHKINDLIWIAGGNGDDKLWYQYYITSKKLKNTLFTDDYSFFKGYEYSVPSQEPVSLLSNTLQLLTEKLTLLAEALSGKKEKKKDEKPIKDVKKKIRKKVDYTQTISSIWSDLSSNKSLTRRDKLNHFVQDCKKFAQTYNKLIPDLKKNENTIRIASYNVHYWTDPFDDKDNQKEILEVIKAINADVIILQEVALDNKETFDYFSKEEYQYQFFAKAADFYGGFGNLLLSKHPFQENSAKQILFKDENKEKRTIAHAVISLPGKNKISVYGTHLDVFDETGKVRAKQIKQLIEIITDDKNENILIAADFNETREKDYNYTINNKKVWDLVVADNKKRGVDPTPVEVARQLTEAGFQDCFTHYGIIGPRFTVWSGTIVDFIYLGKNWNLPVIGCYTYYDAASDHLPIIMDVSLE